MAATPDHDSRPPPETQEESTTPARAPLQLLHLPTFWNAVAETRWASGLDPHPDLSPGVLPEVRAPEPGEEVADRWQFYLDWHAKKTRESLDRHRQWRESTRKKDALGAPDALSVRANEEARVHELAQEMAEEQGARLPEDEAADADPAWAGWRERVALGLPAYDPAPQGGEPEGGALSSCGKGTNWRDGAGDEDGGPGRGSVRTFLPPDVSRPGWGVAGDSGLGGFGPESFLGAVERLTAPHRVEVAARHVLSAEAASVACTRSKAGEGPATVERVRNGERVQVDAAEAWETSQDWHLSRVEGQRRRFEACLHCGEGAVHVRCQGRAPSGGSCGWEAAVPMGCGIARICVACRQRRSVPERERFARAREAVLDRARRLGLLRRKRRGGAYTEKHLTLTIPDGYIVGGGAVSWRVAVLYDAWRKFTKRFRAWLREQNFPGVAWYRGFEWTPGADGLGHPHFHVWIHSPYLPVGLLHWFWALSLRECGVLVFGDEDAKYFGPKGRARRSVRPTGPIRGERGAAACERRGAYVMIDVRQVVVRRTSIAYEVIKGGKSIKLGAPRLRVESTAGQDLIGYIAGWQVSDLDESGRMVPASVNAELYGALEGKKQVRASDGFLRLGEKACACPQCSTEGRFLVRLVSWSDPALAPTRAAIGLPPVRARAGPSVAKVGARQGALAMVC